MKSPADAGVWDTGKLTAVSLSAVHRQSRSAKTEGSKCSLMRYSYVFSVRFIAVNLSL
jgi:hypothetical protein